MDLHMFLPCFKTYKLNFLTEKKFYAQVIYEQK